MEEEVNGAFVTLALICSFVVICSIVEGCGIGTFWQGGDDTMITGLVEVVQQQDAVDRCERELTT